MFTFAQNWNHILVSKKIHCFKISSSWLQQTYTLCCCWCSRKHSCARILKNTKLYQNILEDDAIPKLLRRCWYSSNGNYWGFSVSSTSMAIKILQRDTRDPQQKYFDKKLCSARVVTENAYGMLKGRWRILHKQTEFRMYNLKYVIMSCMMLHNLCISVNNPCEPQWRLEVKQLSLIKNTFLKKQKKIIIKRKTVSSSLPKIKKDFYHTPDGGPHGNSQGIGAVTVVTNTSTPEIVAIYSWFLCKCNLTKS